MPVQVVLGSLADVALTYLDIQLFSSSMFRIVRIAKVLGRVGRLLKVASGKSTTLGIEQILQVFTHSLPNLAYIAVLLGMILFIFAVLGMNLFGKLARNGCIGARSNFEHVPIGMLTLFGIGTKDRVACTMAATMVQEPHCSEADGTCGNVLVSKLYFLFFSFAIMFTTIEVPPRPSPHSCTPPRAPVSGPAASDHAGCGGGGRCSSTSSCRSSRT